MRSETRRGEERGETRRGKEKRVEARKEKKSGEERREGRGGEERTSEDRSGWIFTPTIRLIAGVCFSRLAAGFGNPSFW